MENIGLFCRALLQKRPIILRSLLIVAIQCLILTRLVGFREKHHCRETKRERETGGERAREIWREDVCVSEYRVAKTRRMAYLYRSFSAKEPCN